ncbi:Ribonuclease III domain [Ceraceosorus bombacis]|uniref:Ribonuclease III domain n=1 Tax=Ceraceosorus bombacis TaxID=401625 RepID=A0A0P1BR31_9BASI|nr:Ribonuclease III domain [Ceraceosorus bombacis]
MLARATQRTVALASRKLGSSSSSSASTSTGCHGIRLIVGAQQQQRGGLLHTSATDAAAPSSSQRSSAAAHDELREKRPRRAYSTRDGRDARETSAAPQASRDEWLAGPSSRALNPAPTAEALQRWFEGSFPTLPLPEEVAAQAVTHESFDLTGRTVAGHNRRLSFLGRRAMHLYLSLFLSQQELPLTQSVELLHTAALGERVGAALRLQEVMRWTAARDGSELESGLWTIRGVAVEALVGAIYHQHGASIARDFFHAHVLPHLAISPSARPAVKSIQAASREALASFTSVMSAAGTSPNKLEGQDGPRAIHMDAAEAPADVALTAASSMSRASEPTTAQSDSELASKSPSNRRAPQSREGQPKGVDRSWAHAHAHDVGADTALLAG